MRTTRPRCELLGTIEGGGYEKMYEEIRRVYSPDGISPTVTAKKGGHHEVKIAEDSGLQMMEVPQIVKVRKYSVDKDKLGAMLRTHKTLSNKQIAEKLNVPITNVEHWFRRDEYFSIPDAEIWFQLKELLGIKTDEFDAPITEFEEREGVFEQGNRVYHEDGVSPTIMAETNNGIRIATNNLRIRKLTPIECWRLMDFDDEDFYKAQAIESNTQLYAQAGNSIVVNCLVAIFGQLFEGKEEIYKERTG